MMVRNWGSSIWSDSIHPCLKRFLQTETFCTEAKALSFSFALMAAFRFVFDLSFLNLEDVGACMSSSGSTL